MEDLEPCKKKIKINSDNADSTENYAKYEGSCDNEQKVGIKLFINIEHRFTGIIKQRYSDFMVRECDLDGIVVYLSNLDHCDHKLDKPGDCKATECPITDKYLLLRICDFVKSEDKTETLTLDVDNDKEHRKLVHKYIKDTYKDIETDTVTLESGSRAIKLSFRLNKLNKNRRKDSSRPKNVPKYCHFVLFKQNKDTMDCINLLAKFLKTNSSHFAYAGTKDRRATTTQRISVSNILSQRLQSLNKTLRNVVLGDFSYSDKALSLGDLSGNEFTIIIRNVVAKDGDVVTVCESLKEMGFINYFGLQRFGTGAVATHEIGKALLAGKFEEAVNKILQPPEKEENVERGQVAAKKIWCVTKNAKKAVEALTNKYSIEGKLLEGLSKQDVNKYNYFNAFQLLPRNTRLLYLHSYQSLVWNNAVSKRIKTYGLKPCIGDLILNKEKDENGYETVSALATNDVEGNEYSIYDVVLPLPGYDMVYPSNEVHDFYKDFLASDGLDLDDMRRKQKDISLSGKYRHMVVKPKDLSWETIPYDDFTIPLIENDYEKLTSKKDQCSINNSSELIDGKYKALKLQMTLPSSCYATMALRELLITETSYEAQSVLNIKFQEKDKQ